MIGAIETAMAERLTAASKLNKLGYHYRKVDTLPVDFDERLAEYITDMPAAWTVFGGLKTLRQLRAGSVQVKGEFHVVLGARSLRSERSTRFGAAGDVGSYQMVLDAAGLLLGQDLGLPMEGFEFVQITPLYSAAMIKDRRVSLMSLSLSTTFVLDPNAGPETTGALGIGDFASFRTAWDIPPFGGVTLPAGDDDGGGDAADHVSLPILEPAP